MSTLVERVTELVAPLLADLDVGLYDLEHTGGTLKVVVDRPGGIDLEALALVTRTISRALDHADPMPGRYTLEVTSPGLERTLRTPAHFAGAQGATVAVRTLPHVAGDRRAQGTLVESDDEGFVVRDPDTDADRRLRYDEVERARTVFEWGPADKPGAPKRAPSSSSKAPARDREEAGAS